MKKPPPFGGGFEFFMLGGADRDRTDDLLNAIPNRARFRCFSEVWQECSSGSKLLILR